MCVSILLCFMSVCFWWRLGRHGFKWSCHYLDNFSGGYIKELLRPCWKIQICRYTVYKQHRKNVKVNKSLENLCEWHTFIMTGARDKKLPWLFTKRKLKSLFNFWISLRKGLSANSPNGFRKPQNCQLKLRRPVLQNKSNLIEGQSINEHNFPRMGSLQPNLRESCCLCSLLPTSPSKLNAFSTFSLTFTGKSNRHHCFVSTAFIFVLHSQAIWSYIDDYYSDAKWRIHYSQISNYAKYNRFCVFFV